MSRSSLTLSIGSLFAAAAFSSGALAQTADDVRTDVLTALSTPLPITVVGPLLTRDVVVTEEGDGFRAVLTDTTIMGLFPFGEVSMVLTPIDDDLYRVSDMTFPTEIDVPGVANVTFSDMNIEGIWSASDRSYSDLRWVTNDLVLTPPEPSAGSIRIGQMSFDVVKEPDNTDTESRFEIGLADLGVLGMGPEDIQAAEVRALLAANGERPVDLYSVIREVIVRGTMGGQGGDLMAFGQSLLGNTYSVVTLDLTAEGLDIRDPAAPDEAYLTAGSLTARVDLGDVAPRDWGSAEILIAMQNLEQRDYLPEATVLTFGEAVFAVKGTELPVADMMTTATLLGNPPRGRPVLASDLLDGLMEFGSLEIRTEGTGGALEAFDWVYDNGERELLPFFVSSYDDWSMSVAVSGFDQNEGAVDFATVFDGGSLEPREAMDEEVEPHIAAWFPVSLEVQTSMTGLNEELLKRLLADVEIADLSEPVELAMPMLIYAAASVFEVATGENRYETDLFEISQTGSLEFYPAEVMSLSPYTGETVLTMTGMDDLMTYFEEDVVGAGAMRPDEASAVMSVFTVLSNLAVDGEDGALEWTIARPDIYRREVIVNDITMRYPDILQFLPMMMFGAMGRF